MQIPIQKNIQKSIGIPTQLNYVLAGFPSPAEGASDERLSLDELVVVHPEATFFMKMEGEAMVEAGIFDGDTLVVDRMRVPHHGSVVVAMVGDECVVRRLEKRGVAWYLVPAHFSMREIRVTRELESIIWGVVSHTLHTI